MLLIMDNNGLVTGVLNNDSPTALPYKNDMYSESLVPLTLNFTFETLGNHPDSDLLMNEGAILKQKPNSSEYYYFQIKSIEDDNRNNGIMRKVYCESLSVTELLGTVIDPIEFQNAPLLNIMTTILAGTGWSVLRDDTSNVLVNQFSIERHTNALYVIRELLELLNMEVEYSVGLRNNRIDSKNIHIRYRRGVENGARFVYAENLIGASRLKDTNGTLTSIVALGAENEDGSFVSLTDLPSDIDINHVLGDDDVFIIGRELASRSAFEQFNVQGRHITGLYENRSAETAMDLLLKAHSYLKQRRTAQHRYEIDVALFHHLENYQHREVQIGDTVFVQDMTFNPHLLVQARIIEINISETSPENSTVVMGDFVTLTLDNVLNIEEIQGNVADVERRLNRINPNNVDIRATRDVIATNSVVVQNNAVRAFVATNLVGNRIGTLHWSATGGTYLSNQQGQLIVFRPNGMTASAGQVFIANNGDLHVSGQVIAAMSYPSLVKKDFKELDNPIDIVKNSPIVKYEEQKIKLIPDNAHDLLKFNIDADEELGIEEGAIGLSYESLLGALWASNQELIKRVELLENRLKSAI